MPRSSPSMLQSVVTDLVRQLGEDPKAVAAMVREELGGAGTVELHGQQATDAVRHLWQANPQDWRTREAKRLGGPQFWDEIITRATPPEHQHQLKEVRDAVKQGIPYVDALQYAAKKAAIAAAPPPGMVAPLPTGMPPGFPPLASAAPVPAPPMGLPVQTMPAPAPPSQPVVVTRPTPMPGGM